MSADTTAIGGPSAAAEGVPMEHGKMALILWCRSMSEGAAGVDIVDFGDSWQDGLGFCAIISRFVPTEVLNFASLGPSNRVDNLNLAFSAADKVCFFFSLSFSLAHKNKRQFFHITLILS